MTHTNLIETTLNTWKGREKHPAFTFPLGDKVIVRSFEEQITAAKAFAAEYRKRGIERGDIVILILDHRPELVSAFLGATRLLVSTTSPSPQNLTPQNAPLAPSTRIILHAER